MRMQAYRRSAAFEALAAEGAAGVEQSDGGRYGADKAGVRWPTLAAIVALHLVALWALVTLDVIRVVKAQVAPTVVTLMSETIPPPPPPETPEPTPPVPAAVQVVAPPPIVATPAPAPPIRTVEVAPPPVMTVTAPPTARAGPPSDATTPPDFSGDQLGNPAPKYPSMSRRLREQGAVTVRVTVTPAGRAANCRVQRSSGFDRLDKAALDTVCGWKFQPATRGGVAVDWPMDVPIPFVLRG